MAFDIHTWAAKRIVSPTNTLKAQGGSIKLHGLTEEATQEAVAALVMAQPRKEDGTGTLIEPVKLPKQEVVDSKGKVVPGVTIQPRGFAKPEHICELVYGVMTADKPRKAKTDERGGVDPAVQQPAPAVNGHADGTA